MLLIILFIYNKLRIMSKKSPTKEIKLLTIEEVDFNLPEVQSPDKEKEKGKGKGKGKGKEKEKLTFRERLLEHEKKLENEKDKEKPKNNRIKR